MVIILQEQTKINIYTHIQAAFQCRLMFFGDAVQAKWEVSQW